eukprot:jgi/Botrbrau1/10374/Bobra.146_2s0012.1
MREAPGMLQYRTKAEPLEQCVGPNVGGEAVNATEKCEVLFRDVSKAVQNALYCVSRNQVYVGEAALVLDARRGLGADRAGLDLAAEAGPEQRDGRVLIRQRSWKDSVLARMASNPRGVPTS